MDSNIIISFGGDELDDKRKDWGKRDLYSDLSALQKYYACQCIFFKKASGDCFRYIIGEKISKMTTKIGGGIRKRLRHGITSKERPGPSRGTLSSRGTRRQFVL